MSNKKKSSVREDEVCFIERNTALPQSRVGVKVHRSSGIESHHPGLCGSVSLTL